MDTKQIDKMFAELEARLNKLKSEEQLRYEEDMRALEAEKEALELKRLKDELKAVKKECFYLELNRDLYTFIIPVVIFLIWRLV